MKHNNRLTYIASGCSHMRITLSDAVASQDLKKKIGKAFQKLQSNGDHTFGLLYNAWMESDFGHLFKSEWRNNLECIQADSGGLQIITQGKEITPEIKKVIYNNQGLYSDMAMAFDEIPLSFSGAKSGRLDLSNRWFDVDKFEECARQTGRNVFEQIQTFVDMKSDAKPIFITQGNCYDTYMKWTELAMSEIPQEYQKYIGGVAMGAAALGHGPLEDIKRAFYFTELPMQYKSNHLHLLAVGSVYRLIPNLVFMDSGLYSDLHLTYDSTTHTSGITMGRFYINENNLNFPRSYDVTIYSQMTDSINALFGTKLKPEKLHAILATNSTTYKEQHGNIDDFVMSIVLATLTSINAFKEHVDACVADPNKILTLAESRDSAAFIPSLYKVKNKTDFDYWMANVGTYMKSHPVNNAPTPTLDEWF